MAITGLSRGSLSRDGVALSGTFANRPKNFHDGAIYFPTDLDCLLYGDSLTKTLHRVDGGYLFNSTAKYLSDGFNYGTLDTDYNVNSGNDNVAADPVIDADDGEGSIILTSGDAGTGVAADGSAIGHSLIWEMEEASRATVVTARIAVSAITTVELFVGLTDVLPATTLEMPFDFTDGTTIQSTATDACGFLFDTTADTDTIRLVGVKGGTDGTSVDSGAAPTAAAYHDYTMVVDTDGDAFFFFDGAYEGTVADAITVTVDVSPIVIINATTTASRTASVRRWACHQDF